MNSSALKDLSFSDTARLDDFFGHTAFPPYDYLLGRALPAIAFKSAPHLNVTVFEALILMTSPVPGLRPFLAGRDLILKVPNPTN